MAKVDLRNPMFRNVAPPRSFERCGGWVVQQRTIGGAWTWFDKLTFSSTRSEAIRKYTDHQKAGDKKYYSFHGDKSRNRKDHYETGDALWRAERRAGLVRCIRVELIPSPDSEFVRDNYTILQDVEFRLRKYLRRADPQKNLIHDVANAFGNLSAAIGNAFGFDPFEKGREGDLK